MNIVRCKNCGTMVLTSVSIQERLMDEKNELLEDIQKLTTSILKYNSRSTDKNFIKLKSLKAYKIQKVADVNKLLKELNHQLHEESRDIHEVFSKYLINELSKFGYTKDDFNNFRELADKELMVKTENAKKELHRLYGESENILIKNEWCNSSGAYDPTAKKAIDNINRKK